MKEKVLSIIFFSVAIILFISGFVATDGGISIWVIVAADIFAVLGAVTLPVSKKKHKYN